MVLNLENVATKKAERKVVKPKKIERDKVSFSIKKYKFERSKEIVYQSA